MGANAQLLFESVKAFHSNGWNSLAYIFSTNWCLFLLIAACITTVILNVKEQSDTVVREEQNIL